MWIVDYAALYNLQVLLSFLGVFANFRKETISFVMLIYPSVRPTAQNNSVPSGHILMKFDIGVFLKICREISLFFKIWQE